MNKTAGFIRPQIFYVSCIGLLLVSCLRWYGKSYFYYDDFNCMFLAQRETFWSMVGHIVNPLSSYFRPLYMMAYWVHWNLFGLLPSPYHWFKWFLHALNVGLFYLVLKQFTGSRYGPALAALLFSYQIAFREIFFNFACVGELLCAALMWMGLSVYAQRGTTRKGLLWSYAIFFLALKAKEMAVMLPVAWLAYDLIVREELAFAWASRDRVGYWDSWIPRLSAILRRLAIPFAMTFGYLLLKVPVMGGLVPFDLASASHPYHVNYSPIALPGSFAWYFNSLFRGQLNPWHWLLFWGLTFTFFVWKRARVELFFLAYVFVAFIPVIVLVNRRLPYYWYIPSLGIGGLISLAVKQVSDRFSILCPPRLVQTVGALLFLGVGWTHYTLQQEWTRPMMTWVEGLTEENRDFIAGLQSLPVPGPCETVYFRSLPRYFDSIGAKSVVQVVFRRTDLDGKIVSECPQQSRYCVLFENSRVSLLRGPLLIGNGRLARQPSVPGQ